MKTATHPARDVKRAAAMLEQESFSGNIVLIISGAPIYHRKGAAYERIMNYARALALKGCTVYLTTPLFTSFNSTDAIERSIFLVGGPAQRRVKVSKISIMRYYFSAIQSIIAKNKKKTSVLVFPSTLYVTLTSLIIFKFIFRYPVFCEKNELKIGMALSYGADKKLWKKIVLYSFLPARLIFAFIDDLLTIFFDGAISISTKMEKLFTRYTRTIRIPTIVDTLMFRHDHCREDSDDHIFSMGFFGSISQKKDGVLDLLTAINRMKDVNSSWKINFYGDISRDMANNMRSQYNDYICNGRLTIIPTVKHDQTPFLMAKHDLLLLPRPSNLQVEYGFSTKLAEYMASGVPVLVTDVSDNMLYIEDGKNGFSVPPGDVTAMAKKLREIFSLDYNRMRQIGIKGRETAVAHFDYNNYSDVLFDFLCSKGI